MSISSICLACHRLIRNWERGGGKQNLCAKFSALFFIAAAATTTNGLLKHDTIWQASSCSILTIWLMCQFFLGACLSSLSQRTVPHYNGPIISHNNGPDCVCACFGPMKAAFFKDDHEPSWSPSMPCLSIATILYIRPIFIVHIRFLMQILDHLFVCLFSLFSTNRIIIFHIDRS